MRTLQRAKGREQAQTSRQVNTKSAGGNGICAFGLVTASPRVSFLLCPTRHILGLLHTVLNIVHLSTMAARKISPTNHGYCIIVFLSSLRSRHLLHHQHAKWLRRMRVPKYILSKLNLCTKKHR